MTTKACNVSPGLVLRTVDPDDLAWVQDLQMRTHQGRSMPIDTLRNYLSGFPRRMVILEKDNVMAGYLMFIILGPSHKIIDLAIEPEFQRQGLASCLVGPLLSNRQSCSAIVRDTCLGGQLLLRSLGFRCIQILKGYFHKPDADGYYFYRESKQ